MPALQVTLLWAILCMAMVFGQQILTDPKLISIAADALWKPGDPRPTVFPIPLIEPFENEQELRFRDLLPRAKVVRIIVDRYSSTYPAGEHRIRQLNGLLTDLENNKLEGPIATRACVFRSLELRLQFDGGESMRFIGEGGLVGVEDTQGMWRIYRSLPPSYQKSIFPETKIVFAKDAVELDNASLPGSSAKKADPLERQRINQRRTRLLVDLLDNPEVVRVVVTKYPPRYSEGPIRKTLTQLLSLEIDTTGSSIGWSEGSNWFLECRLELGIRGSARLVTDGWHIYLEDTEGYGWFARISHVEAGAGTPCRKCCSSER